jgi:hypothetical protein
MGSKLEAAVQATLKPAFVRNFTSRVVLAEIRMFSLLSGAIFSATVVLKLKSLCSTVHFEDEVTLLKSLCF